jgi:hypothetical protein
MTKNKACLIGALICFAWLTLAALQVIVAFPFLMPLGFSLWILSQLL